MCCFKIFWVNDKKANDLRQTYRQTYILSLVVLSAALQQKIKLQIMVVIIDGYSDMCAHFADFAKFILGGNLIYFYIYIYISLLQIRACAIYFEPPFNTNTTSLRFLNNINVKYKWIFFTSGFNIVICVRVSEARSFFICRLLVGF